MKLTREQYNKWTAMLADSWKFDAQNFIIWGEKQIYTDSEPDGRGVFYRLTLGYRAECIGRGYMAQETGKQIPTVKIDRFTPTGTGELYNVVQVFKESVAEPENKKNYNVLARLSASLDVAEYFKKAAEADTGATYSTMFDFSEPTDAQDEPETAEAVTDTAEETEAAEAKETHENETAEDTTQAADDTTPAESTEQDAPTVGTAPDMFAALAAAYIIGKTIKSEPKQEEAPTAAEETPEPEEVQEEPPRDGYEKTSDFFTAEEVETLTAGVPVPRKAQYNNAAYFTAPYSEGVRLIYYVSSYDERDRIAAGRDAKFWGVLIGGTVYASDAPAISAKLAEDVNRYLLANTTSEEAAAQYAANVDEYKRERINRAKEQDYTEEARRAFYEHKPPKLVLYYRDDRHTYELDTLINYLKEPQEAIEAEAARQLSENPDDVYIAYIRYNHLSATYGAIKSDTGNEEHKLLKISDCITGQKSVRVELTNGHEVKVEADAVKRLKYNRGISARYVAACDRQHLRKNEYGHDEDIKAADIVAITHGGRVLYRAS